jgi:hypothetical protein
MDSVGVKKNAKFEIITNDNLKESERSPVSSYYLTTTSQIKYVRETKPSKFSVK